MGKAIRINKKERERRELYLSLYIDDHGRDAIDQRIIENIEDPKFWEKIEGGREE